MKGNERLVFDPGNQFGQEHIPPYAVLPAYWRPFVFHVLKPREFAVYMYVVSLCDKNDIAYPPVINIQRDLDIQSPTTVATALSRLEESGFLLRMRAVLPRRQTGAHRTVYQRPLPQYTINRLLDRDLIDGDLLPTNWPMTTEKPPHPNRAVDRAMERLLGDDYLGYESLESTAERTAFLKLRLSQILAHKQATGRLAFELSHGKVGRRTATRLKLAQDELIRAFQELVATSLPQHASDPTPQYFPSQIRRLGEPLEQLVKKQDVKGMISWLESFDIDVGKLEIETSDYVAYRASDAESALNALHDLFASYRRSVKPLEDLAEPLKPTSEVPF